MEECKENCKMKYRTDEEKKALLTRLNRVIGQLNGIKRMIEEDRYCEDVLIQASAAEKAFKGFSAAVFENHMHTCLVEKVQNGELEVVDEVIELFRKFQ